MRESNRMLAVIPARGGSKRLPRKNALPLRGLPLISWTIAAARASGALTDILVSTDDEEIAAIARDAGALVPWLRPTDLATDTATSAAVVQHALAWYEGERGSVAGVVLLQPTSPFRSAASIRDAVASFLARRDVNDCSVVSVSPAPSHPAWCFQLDGDTLQPFLGWDNLERRSQDLPPAFALNGAIYVVSGATARVGGRLLQPGMRPFLMADPREALDIDTSDDWRIAEQVAEQLASEPR